MSKHLAKYVLIEWHDSGAVDGQVWQFKDEWECDTHQCFTVGVLVANTDSKIVVAQSWNTDQWGRLFAIPKKSVVRIERLNLAALREEMIAPELREQILFHGKVTFDNYDKESRSARKLVTIPVDKLMQIIQRHRKGGKL